jgi:signal transduction histidine kinase
MLALGLQFVLLTITAGVRLARDSARARSRLARVRMTGLATGILGLAAAFMLAAGINATGAIVAARTLATLSSAWIAIWYIQPRPLRSALLGSQLVRVEAALRQVVSTDDPQTAIDCILPLIADLVGARHIELREGSRTAAVYDPPGDDATDSDLGRRQRSDILVVDVPRGELVVVASVYAPLFGRGEVQLVGLLGTCLDLALERCEQLERERQAADEVARMKDIVLAAAAHDLRTPLTSVLGFGMTLEQVGGRVDDETRDGMLHEIVSGARRLDRLLDDLLDMARIEHGRLVLDRVDTDLLELTHRVVGELPVGGGQIVVGGSHAHAFVDGPKIERAVENLVTNAAKFAGSEARIEITVAGEGETSTITVDDDGPGVAATERAMIFDPFERGTAPRKVRGSGLGLAIVARLVRAHGGDVEVSDAPAGGARFVLRLPAAAPAAD